MSRIAWEEKYSVLGEALDEQRKKLLAILGQLFDKLGKKRSREFLGAILRELIQHAAEHFTTEKIFLEQYGFPGYSSQKEEHHAFTV